MVSGTSYKFNILLVAASVTLGIFIRPQLFPISNDTKRFLGYPEDSLLNFTELSGKYGYHSEQHTVVTEDGYILTIFRINSRKCAGKLKRTPVILMHGLLLSSDVWLEAGPDAGLAYLISDQCYDLWVGNQRGNYYSRRHTHLDPDKDAEFWKFSPDQIGYYDVPATIDYVLKHTQEKKLNYIGYSQGALTFLAMCSERPGYCEKANLLIGLAPASNVAHCKSVGSRLLLTSMHKLEGVLAAVNIHEIFPKGAITQEFLAFLCKSPRTEFICAGILAVIDSSHPGSITKETVSSSFGHSPAGTSVRTLAQYGQYIHSDRFQKYDHGKRRNMEIYGVEQPPSYNLGAVTVPVLILYGNNDYLLDKRDVLWMAEQLPNVLETIEVADPLWNHFDVPYSQFTKDLIFPKIKEYLSKFSRD